MKILNNTALLSRLLSLKNGAPDCLVSCELYDVEDPLEPEEAAYTYVIV